MSPRDYYEVLGVAREASTDVIKRAYRKQALENHPDRNPGDPTAEARFKEATEAYQVLSDDSKRARYDQFGHAGVRGGAGGPIDFDLADALRTFMRDFGGGLGGFDFFGGGGRRGDDRRGNDLQVRIALELGEVATGVKRQVKLKKLVICESCDGRGAKAGTKGTTCTTCGGRGEVRQVSRSFFGQFINVALCPACDGSGEVIQSPCPRCNGEGREPGEATVSITVPAGVAQGNYLQLRGLGDAGRRGGEPGDVLAIIEEKEHPVFQRHGSDLIMDLPVTYTQAVLGDEVEIPTLAEQVMLSIPRGLAPGKILRLRGQGLPGIRSERRGDILVRVHVFVPERVSGEEAKLLDRLREIESKPPVAGEKRTRWFERMRDALGG
jgi:molecular chaperone DnaJ